MKTIATLIAGLFAVTAFAGSHAAAPAAPAPKAEASLQKVKIRLLPKSTQRLLRQLPRPLPQLSNLCLDDDSDSTTVDDLNLHAGYRRLGVVAFEVPLLESILKRLRAARLAALLRHQQVWG
jgi:hypothetical protein